MATASSLVVALAGRRVDPSDAEVRRFPASNVGLVESRLRELFETRGARILVAAGACGADLIAHDVARSLSMRRVMVLPFAPTVFREDSVVDRGTEWGPSFDELLADAHGRGNEVLELDASRDATAYYETNEAILDRAIALGASEGLPVLAVIVWDDAPRGPDDITAAFANSAQARGLELLTISTLV